MKSWYSTSLSRRMPLTRMKGEAKRLTSPATSYASPNVSASSR